MYVCKRKNNLITVITCVFFLWLTGNPIDGLAKSDVGIAQFVGYYLCEVKTVDEYANPEVFSLSFNGEGQLQKYRGMYYGTTGTSKYYTYTSFSVEGNILTCKYDESDDERGMTGQVKTETHQYILNEDGSISTEGKIWYKYVNESVQEVKPRTLLPVRNVDFPCGRYTPDTTFLGIQELSRREIESIVFLDTLEGAPEHTWDVSALQDGSVKMWVNEGDGCHVCIAADGGVIANNCSNDLFRLCTNLTEIDFNSAFDTSGVSDFSHMFRECRKLSVIQGINSLDTFAVYDMSKMFYGCKALNTLRIDDLTFNQNCSTEDMFYGTKWEGSSPLLDSEAVSISTACILDTSVLKDSPRLRACVINKYDELLSGLSEGRADIWGEWKDAGCYVFYDMEDITGDNIPELIVRTNVEGVYNFSIYYFDIVSCTVRMLGGTLQSNWPELYWYPQEDILNYSTDSGDRNVKVEGFSLRELYDCDVKDLQRECFEYTLAVPEYIEYYTTDLSGDNSQNDVLVKASVNGTGNYNYLAIYIDSIKVFGKKLSGRYSEIEYHPFYTEYQEKNQNDTENELDEDMESEEQNMAGDRSDFLYLHVGSESGSEYTALLEYDDGSFAEALVMSDLVDEDQIRSDYGNNNYFSIEVGNKQDLKTTFYLNTYGLGDHLEFSVSYEHYSLSGFRQRTFVADVDNTWSQSGNVTAKKKFRAFESVRGKDEAYIVNPGEHIRYDKIWFSNGFIWVRIENEAGEKGWIPVGNEVLFEEVREKSEDLSFGKPMMDMMSNEKYFDLDVPDSGVLYQLGKEFFDEGNFGTAEIYFNLIDEESSYYESMKEMLDVIHMESLDALPEETDVCNQEQTNDGGSIFDEKVFYAQYITENVSGLGEDGGYAVLDINGDDRKELLIYYGQSRGDCEVYTFNEQSGKVQYAGIIGAANYGLYYSQQYQSLVRFYRTSDSHSYEFYCFDGKNLNDSFSVGWHDAKGETYTRHFTYTDEDGYHELGQYVYSGENENVEKAEAEKNFHKYLQYMMKIEFTPADDFMYENEQVYTYELSTDNIPVDELDCMLPVIYTYLDSGRKLETDSPGNVTFDTSYREEDLWSFLCAFSAFSYGYNQRSYTVDEIQRLAYSLFADYDGKLPECPQELNVQWEGDTVTFLPAASGELTVCLLEFEVLEDGSIDAVYEASVDYSDDPPEKLFVHFVKNEMADYTSYSPLYYRITSLKS